MVSFVKYLLLGLLLARAETANAEPLHVVTTIETFADLTRAVGGDNVQVQALAHGYQDPHFVEAKPNLLLPLSRADLLVYAGLDLELGWLPPLVTGSRNPRIQPGARGSLDASTAIDVLDLPAGKVDRSQGDIHPRGNPHYWLPPVNALKVAKEIAARLKELDPARSAAYDANLQKFAALLKSKSGEWSRQATAVKGLKVVAYHKSWTYVSNWLGLREIGYVENKPGISPDPKHLAELILRMKAESVRGLLIESFYNRGIAGQVAEAAGAKLLVLPSDVGATPQIHSYVDLVDAVLGALVALAK
jgi:zinc/manganese transport system substrate-binding protein